ncbi:VOC family protein [Nakamurella leprariae]|uniref:VOC family protein n=1 Tax=Nakamurella leprariae TaxID=2803911 RepID=A0A938YIV1_9ACTN|nr:VOC family protein [Nakamurella leprariae]MBM9468663.1 VOC family protein [Nakamurella leprariae]
MQIDHMVVVFDAADLTAESSFWAAVLGATVDADDDWHRVQVDDRTVVAVQLAPDHVPPQWPDGPMRQQIHLDVWVDDFPAAHAEVVRLGALVLQDARPGDDFAVYADPAGHPFCLCFDV